MALTITAFGQILDGTRILLAQIVGTSPRELRGGDVRVDLTHVWHSPQLSAIVEAILEDASLPYGYHIRQRADGVPMVSRAP